MKKIQCEENQNSSGVAAEFESQLTGLPPHHVLREQAGWYSYSCSQGLYASGAWSGRPLRCKGFGCGRELVEESVLEAHTQRERERCAKIAEGMRPTGGRMWTDEQHACYAALTDCAAAIRREK